MKFFFCFCFSLSAFAIAPFAGELQFLETCSPQKDQAIIAFTGDILIHKPLYLSIMQGPQKFGRIWEKVTPLLLKADFGVGNVEGPAALGIDRDGRDHGDVGFIYDDFIYSGTNLVFNYHPRLLSDLVDSGIDLITAANNHATDRKQIGINRTLLAAQEAGLLITGVRKSDAPSMPVHAIATIKNIRTAFIGCTEVLNGNAGEKQVLNCESKEIFDLIKKLAADKAIDAIVILPHWGVEYSSVVRDYQRDYAHRYIEAGALAVVGSHPHVLQPWERYTTRNKREGVIFYSLGNFVASQEGADRQTGAFFYLGLTKAKGEKARVFNGAYAPIFRQQLSIIPFTDKGVNLEEFYGTRMRVGILDQLKKKMCSKD